ncbi:hypothetical protein KP509_17G031100 [Ceratopteris richardii]|uniref:Uncharacterized protein n=1 Tax=Ceratopteris richardii TaxID=49495 RepID=A0A8T2SVL9_CERRI|nr:hypothetical protein KP509_17G031100 [Ceratopteris richardii]KAH7372954.1 hypothetical protein KP509_17G031100 [Ceratopteris richardii]
MSLREFKETLLLVDSSSSSSCQWNRETVATGGGGMLQVRRPPKGRLKDQMAMIERQAAELECTLLGDSLPAASLSPCPPSSPPRRRCTESSASLFPLIRPPKRTKVSDYGPYLVLDLSDPQLPLPLFTEDSQKVSIGGSRLDSHETTGEDPYQNSSGDDCHSHVQRTNVLDNVNVNEEDGIDLVLNRCRVDSEAGLLIQSQHEGLQESLVLWPPETGDCEGHDDTEICVEVPASINSRLMPHQREGVKFLFSLYSENKGGILGDDMGLGKTIQVIAFLSAVLENNHSINARNEEKPCKGRRQALIVSPTSVLRNWEQEFHVWGTFDVAIYHGTHRDTVLKKLKAGSLHVVLTSFDTLRIHGESLSTVEWDCIVVDEAHRLKNDKSDLYRVCGTFQTMRRYGLTGTIMQNKLMDLFNVFDWAVPGCLGTREHFREYYEEPLKQGQRISAPERFVRIAEERRHRLAKVLKKYLLRREKHDTIGHLMMGKEDNVIFCEMSPLQRRVYKRLLETPDFQSLVRKDEPCTCGSRLTRAECCFRVLSQGIIWQYLHRENINGCDSCPFCLILPCLTKLQQVSNHLELIKPNPKDDPEKQKKDEMLARHVLGEDAYLVGGIAQEESFLGLSETQHCGKMRALEILLAHWLRQGDKVLLFSYSVRMLDILDKFLIRKGYCFSRLDGSTAMSVRQSLVDEFNRSPSKQVFLISTRAGGLGINLVSANRVVIFDPNWNPAQDLQAQDRSFRFGQRRHVTVYRLLAAGSLEELVYTRQIYKQQLFNIAVSGNLEKRYFDGVQDSKDHKGELFGISNLFKDLSEEAFTSEIIEKHDKRALNFRIKSFPGVLKTATENRKDDSNTEPEQTGNPLDSKSDSGHKSALQKCTGKKHTKDYLSSVLKAAGVIYSHRNEDVVNLKRKALSKKGNDGEDNVIRLDSDMKDNVLLPMTKKSTSDCMASCKTMKSTGSKDGKQQKAKSSLSVGTQDAGSKLEQFEGLVKFKGMGKTEFCKWLLSISEDERQQLLLEFKNRRTV